MMQHKGKNERTLAANRRGMQSKQKANGLNVVGTDANEDDIRCFTKYTSIPALGSPDEGQLCYTMWISETKWFIKDMRHLLLLKHDRFWRTIMNNPLALESIASFMQNAVPIYLAHRLNSLENKEVAKLYALAHKTVFQIICRLTTPRKSRNTWMDRDHFASIIYEHFIVSVPLIFDFIFVYGRDNRTVSSIVESVVKLQPKYEVDLKLGLQYLINVFASIQGRCESEMHSQNLSEGVLIDLALYVLDCSYNLGSIVAVTSIMRNMCCDVSIEYPISNFYENVVVVLFACIQSANEQSEYLTRLNDARIELLHAFRSIIYVHLDKILQDPANSLLSADKFLGILTECLANNVFVNDYKKHYPIDVDLEILEQAYSSMDKIKLDFIRNAYMASPEEGKNGQKINRRSQPLEKTPMYASDSNETNCRNEAEKAHEVQSHVEYVMDILPHLDPDYVRGVIEHFDCVEKALAVLLEGNADAQIISDSSKDVNDEIVPEDPLDSFYLQTGIDRLNIYDGDEFDVMSKSNVKGTIKKGKGMPGNPKSFKELLDDKRHVNEMRHVYRQYNTLVDVDDDEYDDTFEAMAESESRHIKFAKGARNLVIEESDNDDEAETDDSETESEPHKLAGFDFCENPEIARKRYEERLISKGVKPHAPRETADVRGKPKGQGQDSKVLQNRKNKNEHKASQGNHNRKRGATFKRSRGMIPS
uniref:Putative transcription coactivator complex p100 component n=1 Tax=Anopheles marajoara TaxID=58244 RepID=A0A2M4BFN4_9DIPT